MITAEIRDYVQKLVRRRVWDESDVEDVTQNALLLAHKYAYTFAGRSAYKTWIYRVVMTAIADHVRRARRRPDTVELDNQIPISTNPRARAAARVDLARVERVLERFGPQEEALFWQSVRDGMTEKELAAAHGLTRAAVKMRVHRVRKTVRAALQEAA